MGSLSVLIGSRSWLSCGEMKGYGSATVTAMRDEEWPTSRLMVRVEEKSALAVWTSGIDSFA